MALCDELRGSIIRMFCKDIVKLAQSSGGLFEPIEQDFLNLYYNQVETRRINGTISPEEYRQKGNAFRDFISELIYVRSGGQYRLVDTKIPGYSEKNHDVDLAFVSKQGNEDIVIVAGEVKMTGSPRYRRGNTIQKERKTQSDIDKRLKEVKFTAVDLKLHYTPNETIIQIIQSLESEETIPHNKWWDEWIKTSIPGFYSFWACRLASGEQRDGNVVNADNPNLLLEKFENLKKYNNAVGVFMFKEESGRYVPAEKDKIEDKNLSIDNAVEDLIKFIDKHVD